MNERIRLGSVVWVPKAFNRKYCTYNILLKFIYFRETMADGLYSKHIGNILI